MKLRVQYERDESGWWVASIPAVKGCQTQGRTVDEARRRIREALALYRDDADEVTLVDVIHLSAKARKAIRGYVKRKAAEVRARRAATAAARRAVTVLQERPLKMSSRDAAGLLDLSHQRVHQLGHEAGRARGRRRR